MKILKSDDDDDDGNDEARSEAEARCRAPNRHPERAAAAASHDADPPVESGPVEDEPEGSQQPGGVPEDGGAGVLRADARRRAARRPRAYTGAEEAADEPADSRVERDARPLPVRPGEGFLPEDRVPGS